jgi:hypothetical protein
MPTCLLANTFSAINVVITCNFVADYLYLTDSEYGRLEMNETVTPIANLTDVLPKSQVYLSIGDKEKPLKEVYQSAFIHFLAVNKASTEAPVCYCLASALLLIPNWIIPLSILLLCICLLCLTYPCCIICCCYRCVSAIKSLSKKTEPDEIINEKYPLIHQRTELSLNGTSYSCRICFEEKYPMQMNSCHHVLCENCWKSLSECPFCRQRKAKLEKLYL